MNPPRTVLPVCVFRDLSAEFARACLKFPSGNNLNAALLEEAGELARAQLQNNVAEVYGEAIQVAVVALRIALQGDASLVLDAESTQK